MILYPTETIYALGVNALEEGELKKLFALKQRDGSQTVSWLVRDIADIERYAVLSSRAAKIAEQFLPGPLTLVLPARDWVSRRVIRNDATIAFRLSSDPVAQKTVKDFMIKQLAPLTCTSANVSGQVPLDAPEAILEQFGSAAGQIRTIINDGKRTGESSTVARVVGDTVDIFRIGAISEAAILQL